MHNVIQCERCLKTVLRDGVHTCTPTAGWLKLEQQLSAEREAREKAEQMHRDEIDLCADWMHRALTSEQKLREAQEQEPVAWKFEEAIPPYHNEKGACTTAGNSRLLSFAAPDLTNENIHHVVALYAAPIPPADVADEIERWKEAAADLGRCFDSANKRIAELDSKLTEQTAFADKYAREVIELTHRLKEESTRGFAMSANIEELLEQLSEAKRQAVPEGWKLVPIEPTNAMILSSLQNVRDPSRWITARKTIYKAMISAATQPLATPEERKE